MKIGIFETEEWEKEYLQKALSGHQLKFFSQPVTTNIPIEVLDCDVLCPFIYSSLSAEILSCFTNLKLIATRSTGVDHIDQAYCKAHNIVVCNVPTYGTNTMAEYTFALLLALSKKIIPSVDRTRKGNFSLEGLRGFELAGKTLGIVGFGSIGKRVATVAENFLMHVVVFTRHPGPKNEHRAIQFVDLPTLLATSDIVSLHIPLTPETTHLINKENIAMMKKGSILINTARGAIVETEAILWGLEQGILSYAALDVLEEEKFLKEERALLTKDLLQKGNVQTQLLNHVLLTNENVLITPHNAFNSQEALQEILKTTVENISSWQEGKPSSAVE